MKSEVITSHADCIGRVIIPIEFRRELDVPLERDCKLYLTEPNEDGVFTVIFDTIQPNATITAVIGFLYPPRSYNLLNSTLDLWIEDGKLCLKKTIPQCIITGDTENLIRYQNTDKYISKLIINDLYKS